MTVRNDAPAKLMLAKQMNESGLVVLTLGRTPGLIIRDGQTYTNRF
jgi:hypothetical protein